MKAKDTELSFPYNVQNRYNLYFLSQFYVYTYSGLCFQIHCSTNSHTRGKLVIIHVVRFSPRKSKTNLQQLSKLELSLSRFVTGIKELWIYKNFKKGTYLWNLLTGTHKKAHLIVIGITCRKFRLDDLNKLWKEFETQHFTNRSTIY